MRKGKDLTSFQTDILFIVLREKPGIRVKDIADKMRVLKEKAIPTNAVRAAINNMITKGILFATTKKGNKLVEVDLNSLVKTK